MYMHDYILTYAYKASSGVNFFIKDITYVRSAKQLKMKVITMVRAESTIIAKKFKWKEMTFIPDMAIHGYNLGSM